MCFMMRFEITGHVGEFLGDGLEWEYVYGGKVDCNLAAQRVDCNEGHVVCNVVPYCIYCNTAMSNRE